MSVLPPPPSLQDLSVASPATVSRCGMVYIALEELGWRPYIKTWAAQGLKAAIPEASEELRAQVYTLFDTYVDAGEEQGRGDRGMGGGMGAQVYALFDTYGDAG